MFRLLGLKQHMSIDYKNLENDILEIDEKHVDKLSNAVSYITNFGKISYPIKSFSASYTKSIATILAMFSSSSYNLANTLTLIRAMNYLKMNNDKSFNEILESVESTTVGWKIRLLWTETTR